MKKTYIYLLTLLTVLAGARLQAQQQAQFSQYMLNPYLYNPAIAGVEDFAPVRVSYRKLNTGIAGGNNSFFLSAHKAINQKELNKEDLGALPMRGASTIRFKTDVPRKIRHGVGLTFTNDVAGLWTRATPMVGYAIHLPVGKKYYLAFGANLGLTMTNFGSDRVINNRDAGDAAYNGKRANILQAGLGAVLYSDKFYVGLSSAQLPQGKLRFSSDFATLDEQTTHYYLSAAYRIALDDEFDIIPSALVKYSSPTYAIDGGVRVRYQQNFYAGAAFRVADAQSKFTTDAVTGLVGFTLGGRFDLAYSYDFLVSGLSSVSSGNHEIMIGARLFNPKNASPRIW